MPRAPPRATPARSAPGPSSSSSPTRGTTPRCGPRCRVWRSGQRGARRTAGRRRCALRVGWRRGRRRRRRRRGRGQGERGGTARRGRRWLRGGGGGCTTRSAGMQVQRASVTTTNWSSQPCRASLPALHERASDEAMTGHEGRRADAPPGRGCRSPLRGLGRCGRRVTGAGRGKARGGPRAGC